MPDSFCPEGRSSFWAELSAHTLLWWLRWWGVSDQCKESHQAFLLCSSISFSFYKWDGEEIVPEVEGKVARCSWHAGSYFPDYGSNPDPLRWDRGVLTTGPPGKSHIMISYTDVWAQRLCAEGWTYESVSHSVLYLDILWLKAFKTLAAQQVLPERMNLQLSVSSVCSCYASVKGGMYAHGSRGGRSSEHWRAQRKTRVLQAWRGMGRELIRSERWAGPDRTGLFLPY